MDSRAGTPSEHFDAALTQDPRTHGSHGRRAPTRAGRTNGVVVLGLMATWVAVLGFGCRSADTGRERLEIATDSAVRAEPIPWGAELIGQLDQRLPVWMTKHRVPGVALALTAGTDVQFESGFGVTGVPGDDRKASRSVDEDTLFQVASLSKPVFTELFLRRARIHDWPLDDGIGRWSRRLELPDSLAAVRSRTARQLLSHSAGLFWDDAADRPALEQPGSWRYSGTGYVVLQRALEMELESSLDELARLDLFEPVGLDRSTFVVPASGAETRGHDRSGRALPEQDWERPNAGSSLYSSASDLARFLIWSASDGSELSKHRQVEVEAGIGLGWGLGWALADEGADRPSVWFHWGSNPGFKSLMMFDDRTQRGLVVLTNGDHGLELIEELVQFLAERPYRFFDFYMLHPDD